MGLVFHYTTSEAAVDILRSHSLWFTDCEYLNDPTEIGYCYQLYRDAWENVQQSAGESDSLSYGLLVDQPNPYETYLNIDGRATSARARYYAFSTSLQSDNVGMWAAYARARDAAGCILVFDADELECALEALVVQGSAKGCYACTLHGRVSCDYRETFDQLVRWIKSPGFAFEYGYLGFRFKCDCPDTGAAHCALVRWCLRRQHHQEITVGCYKFRKLRGRIYIIYMQPPGKSRNQATGK